MRKIFHLLIIIFFTSCGRAGKNEEGKIITVSIAPFKYFVEAIAGDDFIVNTMVPAGADPHIYEPYPEQVLRLSRSVAYISDGYLGFEMTWLDRFYETNRAIKRLALSKNIEPLSTEEHHTGEHVEGADPHYWVSPKCALIMAGTLKDFLCQLNPDHIEKYQYNYQGLISRIREIDEKAATLFTGVKRRTFMIYHPNLGYLARDYGLREIPVEYEGKEPPPSRLKGLIDTARADRIKTIFVQREYDTKNARTIADEIGAKVQIIDPLSEDWSGEITYIINVLYASLAESSK